MKQWFFFIGLFACAACQYRVARDPGVLVIRLSADPTTLNILTSTVVGTNEVMNYVSESLTDINPATLEHRPKLAERWEISPDHLQFTFSLRKDVRWHDGVPFTADDVVYTFDRIMDPKVDAASLRVYFKDVARLEKLDAYTIRFIYREPYYKAFEFAAGIPVMPRHIFDDGTDFNTHPAGRHPIGTGPYRFATWKTGQQIVLIRNPQYWGKPPELDGILFQIIPEPNVAFQALKKGELDLGSLRAIQWARQTSSTTFLSRFAKYRYFTPGYSFIAWNARRPQFADRRVRRALTMLIDRESILQTILYGQGMVVSSGLYPLHPSYDQSIAPWPYDPVGAAALLDAAGWSDHDQDGLRDKEGVPLRFTFLYPPGSRLGEALGNMMRENFRPVGIAVEPQQLEWTTFIKTIEDHAFDAATLGWSGGGVEQDPYQTWHSSQVEKGSNIIGFANAEVDRLIVAARREFDPARRAALYRQFHQIIHEEEPYTFLYVLPELVAVDRRFTNVNAYTLGFDQLEWGVNRNVELWQ